jgi:hypothetical protein
MKGQEMNTSLFSRRAIACGAAAVAVAGVTMLGVTPAAQATTTPAARPNTHLTSTMSSPVAGKCTDTGHLTNASNGAPVGGAVVQLLHGNATPVSKTTNSAGNVTFTVNTSTVAYTLHFPGNNSFVMSTSGSHLCG